MVLASRCVPCGEQTLAVRRGVAASVGVHIKTVAVCTGIIDIIRSGAGACLKRQRGIGTGEADVVLTVYAEGSVSVRGGDIILPAGNGDVPEIAVGSKR